MSKLLWNKSAARPRTGRSAFFYTLREAVTFAEGVPALVEQAAQKFQVRS